MTTLLMWFVVVFGAVLQAALPAPTWLGQAQGPVLLGIVLYYGLAHTRPMMLQAAVLAGLLQDALSLSPLGYSSFVFCVVGLIVERFRDAVFVHELFTRMLFGALGAGAVTLGLYGLLAQEDLVAARASWVVLKTVGSLVLGAIIVPLECELLAALDRMLGNVEAQRT